MVTNITSGQSLFASLLKAVTAPEPEAVVAQDTEARLESWLAAETEVMNLQLEADVMGLPREEWLYRVGRVEAAKVTSEAAWTAYEAANFAPAPELESWD